MPSEAAGGGERAAEEAGGGSLAGQSHVAGCRQKKALKPARARQLVEYLRTSYWQGTKRLDGSEYASG